MNSGKSAITFGVEVEFVRKTFVQLQKCDCKGLRRIGWHE